MSIAEMSHEDALYGRAMDQAPTSAPGAKHNKERKMSDDKNTQLARRDNPELSRTRYEPQSLAQLIKYADLVVKSNLCPDHIKNGNDALLIMQRGAEMGLTAVSALQNMYVVKGKVSMSAQLAVGVCKASHVCEYFQCVEYEKDRVTWETKRRGNPEPTRFTFTKHDAQTAGLWGSGTWAKYPQNMMSARASMNLARMEYPDLMAGIYTPEELNDNTLEIVEPAPAVGPAETQERRPAESGDTIDAEFEEGAPEPPEPKTHWSMVDHSSHPKAAEDDADWSKASRRYFALTNEGDCEELQEDFRSFIKSMHSVESWKQIPAATLDSWCNTLAKKGPEPQIAGEDVTPSERWEWMRDKLDKWQAAQDSGEAA